MRLSWKYISSEEGGPLLCRVNREPTIPIPCQAGSTRSTAARNPSIRNLRNCASRFGACSEQAAGQLPPETSAHALEQLTTRGWERAEDFERSVCNVRLFRRGGTRENRSSDLPCLIWLWISLMLIVSTSLGPGWGPRGFLSYYVDGVKKLS